MTSSYATVLRLPSVARILVSMTLGRVAAAMVAVAVVLLAFTQYRSPELAGAVSFALAVPALLVGPIAGAILDRRGRARLVALDNAASAIALALIAGLSLLATLPAWLFVAIVALSSLTSPLSLNGLRSMLPVLVPEPLWGRVNALDSASFVVAQLAGPVVAALLIEWLGGPAALLAIGCVLMAAGLIVLGVREPPVVRPTSQGLLNETLSGLRYTLANRTLRGLTVTMAAFYFGYGVLMILVPAVVLERLREGPATVGLAWATMAFAGGIAALAAGRTEILGRERRVLTVSIVLTALGLGIVPFAQNVEIVIVGMLIIGFAQGPLDIAMFTMRQRATDPAWMGRAFAISVALNGSGSPVGAVIAGALVGVSIVAVGTLAVATTLIAAALAWMLLPRNPDRRSLHD